MAHPDLVPVAQEIFREVLGEAPNQLNRMRTDVLVTANQLLHFKIPGSISEAGFRSNISVALQYLNGWLDGLGAVALFNLMEDAATAEISRAQLWQWVQHQATLDNGTIVTTALYNEIADDEMQKIEDHKHLKESRKIIDALVLNKNFPEFLTLPAYDVYTKTDR